MRATTGRFNLSSTARARIDRSVNDSSRIAGSPLERFLRDHGSRHWFGSSAYWATPRPNDQFSFCTSMRLIITSSGLILSSLLQHLRRSLIKFALGVYGSALIEGDLDHDNLVRPFYSKVFGVI